MAVLTPAFKKIINAHRLGYVGTASPDGTPNVSPKGTFMVIDDEHIAFGEIRSPNTVANLRVNPQVDINFVDPFTRKGCRIKGRAAFLQRGSEDFEAHLPKFEAIWGELCDRMSMIVMVSVKRALPLMSPAYDIGATEDELRRTWMANFQQMHDAAMEDA